MVLASSYQQIPNSETLRLNETLNSQIDALNPNSRWALLLDETKGGGELTPYRGADHCMRWQMQ